MIQKDKSLSVKNLRAARDKRMKAIFDDQFFEDLKYVHYRPIYEKQKSMDASIVDKEVKKIITPERIREMQKALHNPNDKLTASKVRDWGDRLQAIEDRMCRKPSK